MSNYIRSKGTTFTQKNKSGHQIERGLRIKNVGQIDCQVQVSKSGEIAPESVSAFFSQEPDILIRQFVSILDKVIRKPRSLRQMDIHTYIDRTKLSNEIWLKLKTKIQEQSKLTERSDRFEQLEQLWLSKVHPYARNEFDPNNPANDENAKFINELKDEDKGSTQTRKDSQGRWHKALWKETNGEPDYSGTADAIFDHLSVRAIKINQKPTDTKGGKPVGLIAKRSEAVRQSATDPREMHTSKNDKLNWDNLSSDEQRKIQDVYFASDVAESIVKELEKLRKTISDEAKDMKNAKKSGHDFAVPYNRRARYDKVIFGQILYTHFGKLRSEKVDETVPEEHLFILHNKVRNFYQKIARKNRIEIAMRAGNKDDLTRIVPKNKVILMKAIGAKTQNADMSEFIRIGKLIVHASDILEPENDLQEQFKKRMDYFATSDGQSEIKRNEAFTRVWRNSVALSLRSLKTLIKGDWNFEPQDDSGADEDLTGKKVSRNAVVSLLATESSNDNHKKKKTPLENYNDQIPLIFGDKTIPFCGNKSRASIFLSDDVTDIQENLWTLLRLASEVRHRTNHFSTKQRLVRLIKNGILSQTDLPADSDFKNREGNIALEEALNRLEVLLEFDSKLRAVTIAGELDQMRAKLYLDSQQFDQVCNEMSSIVEAQGTTVPKFMSVMGKVKNLSQNDDVELPVELKGFAQINWSNLSKTTKGLNHCQVGILRHLYKSGFRSWLASAGENKPNFSGIVDKVVNARARRSLSFQEQKKQHYQYFETWLDKLTDEDKQDANSLTKALAAYAASDGQTVRNYKSVKGEQSKRSGWIEEVRQEIFAYLFADYLDKKQIEWIWTLKEAENTDEKLEPIDPAEIKVQQLPFEPWHSQFYAWLYLIPSDDISLLRHQLRKSSILEEKAATETNDKLISILMQMDFLMGLYTKVQSAGFSGQEHTNELRIGNVFYQTPQLFNDVYSEDLEKHHISVPGTRRGLRQIARYGHHDVLKGIYSKHKVLESEVTSFMELKKDATTALFSEKQTLHDKIFDLAKKKEPDMTQLRMFSKEYQLKAIQASKYNFDIAGARLTDHANLHHLMMRVVGRLTDYTVMWERDRIYAFLGMLYKQKAPKERYEINQRDLVIYLPTNSTEKDATFVNLWTLDDGFSNNLFYKLKRVLSREHRALFERHFGAVTSEHPKDIETYRNNLQLAKKNEKPKPIERPKMFGLGRTQIRNDFAHFNVIGQKWSLPKNAEPIHRNYKRIGTDDIHLTYLINSVRSLLSYDRKLKNAVSQSIIHILQQEGLSVEWDMKHERLKDAKVTPLLQTHLGALKKELRDEFAFALPQASVRYVSMVQALFSFRGGGHREGIKSKTKNRKTGKTTETVKKEGKLTYPPIELVDGSPSIPKEILYEFPKLGSENG